MTHACVEIARQQATGLADKRAEAAVGIIGCGHRLKGAGERTNWHCAYYKPAY
ncbi:conserved hypothetical protein [Ricinus communis]|uniref:Uncharacterized protein n=1 Tax=Ricinus communis TaxID=3988 RepID=B9T9Y4_RICCO|nr:conserved hypothetical protein [Ricinus communis]